MRHMKKRIAVFLAVWIAAFALGVVSVAAEEIQENQSGDRLLFSAETEAVSDEVEGDLLAFATILHVDTKGTVKGSIRAAASEMRLDGKAQRNVTVAGLTVETGEEFSARDVAIAGNQVLFMGTCENLSVYGSTVIIGGTVTGELSCEASTVILLESASFQNADISAQHEPVVAKNATDADYKSYKDTAFAERVQFTKQRSNFVNMLVMLPFRAAGAVLLALFLQLLLKKSSDRLSVQFHERPLPFLMKGFLGLFVLPLASFLLLFSAVASVLGAVALMLWALLCVISTAFAAVLLGRLWLAKQNPYLSSALVAAAIAVLSALPFIGSLVSFFCVLLTFGAAMTVLFRKKQQPQDVPLNDVDFRV